MPGHLGWRLKNCSKCGRHRTEVEHFYCYLGTREKRVRSICKPCHAQQSERSRQLRRPTVNAQARARRRGSIAGIAYSIFKQAKDRARKRNLEFSITRKWIEAALEGGRCGATGVQFDTSETATRQNPLAPSLDRMDPKFGYVVGNCRLVTWIYNRAKGDGSDEDVFRMLEALNAIRLAGAK